MTYRLISTVCKICGTDFYGKWKKDRGIQNTCSRKCKNRWLSIRVSATRNRLDEIALICDGCGKAFSKPRYKIKESGRHFCDKACRKLNAKTAKNCLNCKSNITGKNSKQALFCSRQCSSDYRICRVVNICRVCNKAFRTRPSETQTTCSYQCGAKLRGINQLDPGIAPVEIRGRRKRLDWRMKNDPIYVAKQRCRSALKRIFGTHKIHPKAAMAYAMTSLARRAMSGKISKEEIVNRMSQIEKGEIYAAYL